MLCTPPLVCDCVFTAIDKNNISKSLKELDKEFKVICDELLKFASEGSKLYKPYAAWGQYVDKINEAKQKQDQLNDEDLRHLNETIAWFLGKFQSEQSRFTLAQDQCRELK